MGKRLMVRKQGRHEVDILNIGLALARQHVGALRYERKSRQYRQAILLKVPPFEVPVEVALAVIEDNAASSMLEAMKPVLRKSRRQVVEAIAPEDIGSKVERNSEYCCMGPVEPTGRAPGVRYLGLRKIGCPKYFSMHSSSNIAERALPTGGRITVTDARACA